MDHHFPRVRPVTTMHPRARVGPRAPNRIEEKHAIDENYHTNEHKLLSELGSEHLPAHHYARVERVIVQ